MCSRRAHLQPVLRTDLQHPGRKLKDDAQILHSCVQGDDSQRSVQCHPTLRGLLMHHQRMMKITTDTAQIQTVNSDMLVQNLCFSQHQMCERLQSMMGWKANNIFHDINNQSGRKRFLRGFSRIATTNSTYLTEMTALTQRQNRCKGRRRGYWSAPSLWRYCTVRSWPFSGELALVDWSSSTCRAAARRKNKV